MTARAVSPNSRTEPRTLVFFESPRRLGVTLGELAEAFGQGRPAVVCRELTKTHEEIRRGSLNELADWAAGGVLGEVTVVVAGRTPGHKASADTAHAADDVARRQAAGLTRKEAIAAVAADLGLPRRTVYDAVVASKSATD